MKNQPVPRHTISLIAALLMACSVMALTVSATLAAADVPILKQNATATPSGGFQFPTATQTIVGAPTSTPTRTPTTTPVQARIIGDPTNLRDGPGLDFEIIAELSPGDVLPIVVFTVTLTLAYALTQGNIGTAYRQRTQVTMFFFLFMGVGIELRRQLRRIRLGRGLGLGRWRLHRAVG